METDPFGDDLLGDDVPGDDPFDDDLAEQLAAKAPRRIVTRTTVVLAAALLLSGGFAAGTQVQKHYGSPAAASPTTAAGPGPAAAAAARGQQPSASALGALTGTVKLVDKTTIYVEIAGGQVVIVKTTGDTAVQSVQKGALSDLKIGARVTVEGQRDGDTLTASKVTRS